MDRVGERILLRAYLQSADRTPLTPTYERIIKAARHEGLAGVTVLRGILGAGYHELIQPSSLSLVEHVPMTVEIVDDGEKIARFACTTLAEFMRGTVTLERAAVLMCRTCADGLQVASNLPGALPPLSTIPALQPGRNMTVNENGILIRAFMGESDRYQDKPLYEQIVQKARELGMAGATVLRGSEGFGANSVVHKANLLDMSTDLPIVIEMVDTEANVQRLLPHLHEMVKEGMITMEYVVILAYHDGGAPAATT